MNQTKEPESIRPKITQRKRPKIVHVKSRYGGTTTSKEPLKAPPVSKTSTRKAPLRVKSTTTKPRAIAPSTSRRMTKSNVRQMSTPRDRPTSAVPLSDRKVVDAAVIKSSRPRSVRRVRTVQSRFMQGSKPVQAKPGAVASRARPSRGVVASRRLVQATPSEDRLIGRPRQATPRTSVPVRKPTRTAPTSKHPPRSVPDPVSNPPVKDRVVARAGDQDLWPTYHAALTRLYQLEHLTLLARGGRMSWRHVGTDSLTGGAAVAGAGLANARSRSFARSQDGALGTRLGCLLEGECGRMAGMLQGVNCRLELLGAALERATGAGLSGISAVPSSAVTSSLREACEALDRVDVPVSCDGADSSGVMGIEQADAISDIRELMQGVQSMQIELASLAI
eukprot:gnl/Dysnectes_brevis/7309_a12142_372.p1 GENE.gnl/Dysnectes_brevis/7309_a12142_372~~gnl/Dysnectes_brevis/7309_a12142_372.p1  ORF type:complete len:393 (-),score=26.11 gnl/Dysnectes_brevis/7309_a12142_372:84-1262(-)